MKLLLVFLLLHRFETTISVSQEELITHENFKWDMACNNHPFAKDSISHPVKDSAGYPDYTCDLTFDYDREMVKDNDQDELEATAFCELQYPHRLVNWVYDKNKKTLLCHYKVFRVCLTNANRHKPSAWIGDYCVYLLKKPYKQEEAQQKCEEVTGVKYSLLKDETVAGHIMRWFKSDQVDSKRMWINKTSDDFASKYEMHLMNLDYEAVGNRRPGHMFKLKGKGGDKEAMVACVTDSVHLGGEKQKVSHCGMLKDFFKMKTFENQAEKFKNLELTCYSLSQSIMVAMQHTNKSSQLSTVSHFHEKCPLRQNKQQKERKYAVFPSSKYQMEALNALRDSANNGKDLLLAGSQEEFWDSRKPDTDHDETKDSMDRSFFAYRRMTTDSKTRKEISESAGFSAFLWKKGYPKQPEGSEAEATFPNQGALVWTTDANIENVYNYRRAPIVCAAGVQMAEFYECEDGWEMVERPEEKKAFCFKAFSGEEDAAKYGKALSNCRKITNNPKASLAPASTDEELAAISAAVRTWNGGPLHYKSMVIGGHIGPESNEYEWHIDNKTINMEWGWVYNQPDRGLHRDCGSAPVWSAWKSGANTVGEFLFGGWLVTVEVGCTNYYDNIVALRFNSLGNTEGLIDVVGQNPAISVGYLESFARGLSARNSPTWVKGYVCAVEAKNKLVDL